MVERAAGAWGGAPPEYKQWEVDSFDREKSGTW